MKVSNIIRFPIERRRGLRLLLPPARPASDPLLDYMKERRLPLTRDVYLALAYPEGAPNPLPGELEAAIPDELK